MWSSISASRDGRDWDSETQNLGTEGCLHCKSQTSWRWGRGNNGLLYTHHLIKEQVHDKQKEALFHPIHGAVEELTATGCCGGLNDKRDDIMPWRRGAYQMCLAREAPKPLIDRNWMGLRRSHEAICCFLALSLSIFHWPLQDTGY